MSDEPTDKQIEESLSEGDQLELRNLREYIKDTETAANTEGPVEGLDKMRVFRVLGEQYGTYMVEYGFRSEDAVKLVEKYLDSLLPEDGSIERG